MARKSNYNEGTIRERADGFWEVRIRFEDGKQKSFYVKGARKDALALKRQLIAKRDRGAIIVMDHQTTLAKYLTQWLASKTDIRPRTRERYEGEIRNHIIPALGNIKLAKLTRQHILAFFEEKRRSGLSDGSISNLRSVLSGALTDAVNDDILPRNVASHVKGIKRQRPEMTHWTAEQAKTFLAAIAERHDPLEAFYVLALTTGMRRGEILALHWRDVDLKNGTLKVRNTLRVEKGSHFYFEPPKTTAGIREIPLPELAINALMQLKRAEKVVSLGGKIPGSNHTDLIFKTDVGTPWRGNHILQRHFEPLCRELGLPRIRLHDLRHTCASLLYALGYQDVDIAKILGHSNASITREIYIHSDSERLRSASNALNTLLSADFA